MFKHLHYSFCDFPQFEQVCLLTPTLAHSYSVAVGWEVGARDI